MIYICIIYICKILLIPLYSFIYSDIKLIFPFILSNKFFIIYLKKILKKLFFTQYISLYHIGISLDSFINLSEFFQFSILYHN